MGSEEERKKGGGYRHHADEIIIFIDRGFLQRGEARCRADESRGHMEADGVTLRTENRLFRAESSCMQRPIQPVLPSS